jgi:hypothetical protein
LKPPPLIADETWIAFGAKPDGSIVYRDGTGQRLDDGSPGLAMTGTTAGYVGGRPDEPLYIVDDIKDACIVDKFGYPAIAGPAPLLATFCTGKWVVIVVDSELDARRRYPAVLATVAGAAVMPPPDGGIYASTLGGRFDDRDFARLVRTKAVPMTLPKAEATTAITSRVVVPIAEPYPLDVFPEPLRAYIAAAADSIGCDAAFVAQPMLSAAAAAIGNTSVVELKPEWTEPCAIWTATVALPSTGKSPGQDAALVAVYQHEKAAQARHQDALNRYTEELAEYEAAVRQRKADARKPMEPKAESYYADDITTEALAVLLRDNPRGIGIFKDELKGYFDFDRYTGSGGDVTKYLTMHGGRSLKVDRKKGGSIFVPRALVSISGCIQPDALRRALGSEYIENGLASRFCMVWPDDHVPGWSTTYVPEQLATDAHAIIARLYGLPFTDVDGTPQRFRLTSEAKNVYIEWVEYNAAASKRLGAGPGRYFRGKLKGGAARFALVFHLTRTVAGDPTLADGTMIDVASVLAGIRLAEYFAKEAERVYIKLRQDPNDPLMHELRQRGGSATVRELMRSGPCYPSKDAAMADLKTFEQHGLGKFHKVPPGPQGGHPLEVFRLHGTTDTTDTTPPATGSGGGSVSVSDSGWGDVG